MILVALPLKGIVDRIYSADDHFSHGDFKEIAEIINPLGDWILREGRKPQKFVGTNAILNQRKV